MGIRVPDQASESAISTRKEMIENGEPLFESIEMSVLEHGEGDSKRHTIPDEAATVLGITSEDDVAIDVYEDGYWVRPAGGEGEE